MDTMPSRQGIELRKESTLTKFAILVARAAVATAIFGARITARQRA